jgi:pimeloyl-ACP methyl ester carboxylesterase
LTDAPPEINADVDRVTIMSGVTYEVWGSGTRVVLVHGSLTSGPIEWDGQRPLADEGYQLVVPTRRAYTAAGTGEDFVADGKDVAELLGDGAHLVGHSYGALAALEAAAARPGAVYSLVLAEPPLFAAAPGDPDVARFLEQVRTLYANEGSDREFFERLLRLVGAEPEDFPPEELDEMTQMVPAMRQGRVPWDASWPMDQLSSTSFPIVVVSGGHDGAFTAICEAMARDLGARTAVVQGAGHEMQTVAADFNGMLLELWRGCPQ